MPQFNRFFCEGIVVQRGWLAPLRALGTLAMACLLASGTARADVNWDGDAASGDFTDSFNWFGNTVPTFAFTSGNLVFSFRNSASQLNQYYNFASWANINDIIWAETWPVATTFNGNGNGLNFNQRLENRSSSKVTIGTMNLSGAKNGASQIELNPVSGDLQLDGNIYNDNNVRYKVYGANSKMLTINTALTGNNSVGLDIEQYSKVRITKAQTMGSSASFNVNQGELWLSVTNALASGAAINVGEANANTAKLYLENTDDSHSITVTNSGGTKVIGSLNTSGVNTYSGNITLSGAVNLEAVQSGGTVDFTGVIGGGSGVTITGAGTVKLSAGNSYTGGTTVSSGTLLLGAANRLADSGAFTINGGTANLGGFSETVGAVSINGGTITNGALTGSGYSAQAGTVGAALAGSGGLSKSGNGILYLSGENSYSGSTTVSAGTIELQNNSALGNTNGATTISTGAQIKLYSPTGLNNVAENIGLAGTGIANGGAILSTGGNNVLTGALTLNGGTRINTDTSGGSGSLTISGAISGGNNTIFLGANGAAMTISGVLSGGGASQDGSVTSLYKDGSSALTLSGANTYTGDTRIAQGNLTVSSGGNLGNGTSDVFIADGASLTVNANATVASLQEWGITNSGTATIGTSATLTVSGNDYNTFMNSIGGGGNLVKSGTGTMNLFGTQGYNGATTVSGGRLNTDVALASSGVTVSGGTFEAKVANVLGDSAAVTVNSGTYLLGGNDTIGALSGTGGAINLGANRLTTTVSSGSSSYTGGAISGTGGGLTKAGIGRLDLGGTHSYTGNTEVSAGDLRLVGATLTSSSVSVVSGAKLSGYGSVGTIGGAGSIDPGNSPGIITTTQVDPSAGTDYNFEFTGLTPSFGVPAASVNDLIRATGATPFTQSLSAANIINVYFSGSALFTGSTPVQYTGGFFTDQSASFASSISGATFNYFFQNNAGSIGYNDANYYTRSQYETLVLLGTNMVITVSTVAQSANFGGGNIDGQILQIDVVPEPSTYALLGLGAAALGIYQWRRRRRTRS